MPTWPFATLLFPVAYLPLLVTDSRLLRPVLLIPLAVALFVIWARRLPPPRVATLGVIFVTLFALSHVIAALTVPAVGIGVAAILFGWAAWSLADGVAPGRGRELRAVSARRTAWSSSRR